MAKWSSCSEEAKWSKTQLGSQEGQHHYFFVIKVTYFTIKILGSWKTTLEDNRETQIDPYFHFGYSNSLDLLEHSDNISITLPIYLLYFYSIFTSQLL